ncbi:hypothetical protein ACFOZ7_03265 [Natribaculum luteum]|uniref:Uncharacterized protein n=1 Tax=Natribaculum luteum TaxID=1586232 RepID=A0ABD5NVA8_9EURY|nr:hypothetical protein [Natribaculum luteum]
MTVRIVDTDGNVIDGGEFDLSEHYEEVNCLGVKWFETPPASRHHGRSKIFRTTPRLASGLPFYPSNSAGV